MRRALPTLQIAATTLALVGVAVGCPSAGRASLGAAQKGTHFLAELQGGAALFGSGGPAFGLVLGGGGRIPRAHPRVYLIGELSGYSAHTAGQSVSLDMAYVDRRAYLDLAIGLRVYVPLLRGLRLVADLQAGGSRVDALLERTGLPPRAGVGWRPLLQVAPGVQYRWRRSASLGLRYRILLTDDDLGGLRALVHAEAPRRSILTASATWHF